MRFWRKNTIFRVYLFLMCAFFVFGCVGALQGQRRFYAARLEMMESRISDLSAAVESARRETEHVVSGSGAAESASTINRQPDPFWIEGHGTNRKWAYLDICFNDGYRARYYFRPFPSKRELVNLHRRITHDANVHMIPLDLSDDFG